LYRRLDGPHGLSGQVREISSPLGFDSRTVQPVASRHTDYATRPHILTLRLRLPSDPSVTVFPPTLCNHFSSF
jgi:hypothetical protein